MTDIVRKKIGLFTLQGGASDDYLPSQGGHTVICTVTAPLSLRGTRVRLQI